MIDSPARLIVAVLGSLASTTILYPIYAERFWAIPPSYTDMIVFSLVIAGIGFTSSINPLDRHVKQRRARRRKKHSEKHESHPHHEEYGGVVEVLLNSSIIRSIELILTVTSFFCCHLWHYISWHVFNEIIPGQETLSGREKISLGKHIIIEQEIKCENS